MRAGANLRGDGRARKEASAFAMSGVLYAPVARGDRAMTEVMLAVRVRMGNIFLHAAQPVDKSVERE
jgi:hypothetical protein